MGTLPNQIAQGILLGGLYALLAMGLSLSVGVMRFVNLAHGDMIVLASYLLLTLITIVGLDPTVAAATTVLLAFGAGYLLQRYLLQRVLGNGTLPPILVTFGLSIMVQNFLQGVYGANTRKIAGGAIETATIKLAAGVNIGVLPLTIFLAAVVMVLFLDTILYRTRAGARIRAVSDDVAAAKLVGLPAARIYAGAMGLVGSHRRCSGSIRMAVWVNFDPTSGPKSAALRLRVRWFWADWVAFGELSRAGSYSAWRKALELSSMQPGRCSPGTSSSWPFFFCGRRAFFRDSKAMTRLLRSELSLVVAGRATLVAGLILFAAGPLFFGPVQLQVGTQFLCLLVLAMMC